MEIKNLTCDGIVGWSGIDGCVYVGDESLAGDGVIASSGLVHIWGSGRKGGVLESFSCFCFPDTQSPDSVRVIQEW